MSNREVVVCVAGPNCKGDDHGWDCPLSDPEGDVLRMMMDPIANPILEKARRAMLDQHLKTHFETEGR